MKLLEPHLVAKLFPMMGEAELKELAADIAKHGLREPILTLKGQVLDGRNRQEACRLADVRPRFEKWSGSDPLAFVLSKNLHRRHLDTSQRAMVGARALELFEFEAKERQRAGGRQKVPANLPEAGEAREKAAALTNVSPRSIEHAHKVLKQGAPELIQAVDAQKVAVSDAVEILDRPTAEQAELVYRVLDGKAKTLKRAAKARRLNDAYYTEDPLALAITGHVAELLRHITTRPTRILEPSSGGGAFLRAAADVYPGVELWAVDIDEDARDHAGDARFERADFLAWPGPGFEFDLIIGNPEYKRAQAHVEKALELLRPGGVVAFLLRIGFLASAERAELNSGPGRTLAPVIPRPSFTDDGETDASEYGVFIWVKDGAEALPLGDPIRWVPSKSKPTTEAACP